MAHILASEWITLILRIIIIHWSIIHTWSMMKLEGSQSSESVTRKALSPHLRRMSHLLFMIWCYHINWSMIIKGRLGWI